MTIARDLDFGPAPSAAGIAATRAPVVEPEPSRGLSSQEAAWRLAKYGPNEVAEEKQQPILIFLRKMWAPMPWMLEATVLLELALGRNVEALIMSLLLMFNAFLSFLQENRAQR